MFKSYCLKLRVRLLFILIILLGNQNILCIAQTLRCVTEPVPIMFVPKRDGQERRQWFFDHKYKPLCDAIGKSDVSYTFYNKDDFKQMINHFGTLSPVAKYMRVYFATYGMEGSPNVPVGFEDLMTLIFAPLDAGFNEIGDNYYTISPFNANDPAHRAFDPVGSKLSLAIKSAWEGNYVAKKLPVLYPTINQNDPENVNPPNTYNITVSDTRMIVYDLEFISEMVKEMDCQQASGVKAEFASYTDNGKDSPAPPNNYKYAKRMIIQWELTERIGANDDVFYIDDRDGFAMRKRQSKEVEAYEKNSKKEEEKVNLRKRFIRILSFNHGNLCPNNCP